jgi:hypothetical protein
MYHPVKASQSQTALWLIVQTIKNRLNMSDKQNVSVHTISFGGVLFLVFLVLKLCHVIDWNWWWITAPLWGGALLGVIGILALILFAYIASK